MSTQVTYKGSTIANFTNDTKTLKTAGKYMEDDVTITEVIAGQGNVWQDEDGYVHLDDESGLDFQAKSVNPTESSQTVKPDAGYTALSQVTVGAISSTYVGTGIARKSSTDLTASGSTVTVPTGYYSAQATKNISGGQAFTPAVTITTNPTFSLTSNTGQLTAAYTGSSNITPTVTAGYIAAGTSGKVTTTGTSTYTLATQAATTYNVSTADQTIASYRWLTGAQTIKSVVTLNLIASNIKSGVTVKVGDANNASRITQVTGTLVEGVDAPTFTVTWDDNWTAPISATCNKTYAECKNYYSKYTYIASAININQSHSEQYSVPVSCLGVDDIEEWIRYVSYNGGTFPGYDLKFYPDGTITINYPSVYTRALNITQNGTIRNYDYFYDPINVNVSTKYTATIRAGSTGYATRCYVKLNNGTKYYTAGDTFEFSAGDSLYCYGYPVYSPSSMDFYIMVNNVTVAQKGSASDVSYYYTMPAKNIEIFLTDSSMGQISIIESVIPLNYMAGMTVTPSSTTKTLATSSKYLTSNITINGDANLVPSNIAEGVSIFGVSGTHAGSGGYTADTIAMRSIAGAISGNATKIGSFAFYSCSELTQVSFPSCTLIGEYAFTSCKSLAQISFPLCTSIEAYAFSNCTSLTQVSFPACTSLSMYVFAYCSALTQANFSSCTSIGNYAFTSCSSLSQISFPVCTSIGSSAFAYCYKLSQISFPSCTSIGSYAFYACSSLTQVSFPVCTSIGAAAFSGCSSLAQVSFPLCISISNNAFYRCSKLTQVSFPSCTAIGGSAFYSCTSLSQISFPLCTSVGTYAFNNCTLLSQVSFPSCTIIATYAFSGCSSLSQINFPVCTTIQIGAFLNCTSLSQISFSSCTIIGASAFRHCTLLNTAIFSNVSTTSGTINNGAFSSCVRLLSLYLLASLAYSLSTTFSNTFMSTPIYGYTTETGGVYGSIFVPSSLYNTYIAATNWSAGSSRFVSLTDAQINNVLNYGRHDP